MNSQDGNKLATPSKKTGIQNQNPVAPSRFRIARTVLTFGIELLSGAQLHLQKFACFQGASLFQKQRTNSKARKGSKTTKMQGVLFKSSNTFVVLYDTGTLHVSAESESACDALVKKLGRMADVCHGSDIRIRRRFLEFTVAVTSVDFLIDQMYFHYKNYRSFVYEPCLSPYVVGKIDGISVLVAESKRFLMCGDVSKFAATERVVLRNIRRYRFETFVVARDEARLAGLEQFVVVDSEGTHVGLTGIQKHGREKAQEAFVPANQARVAHVVLRDADD